MADFFWALGQIKAGKKVKRYSGISTDRRSYEPQFSNSHAYMCCAEGMPKHVKFDGGLVHPCVLTDSVALDDVIANDWQLYKGARVVKPGLSFMQARKMFRALKKQCFMYRAATDVSGRDLVAHKMSMHGFIANKKSLTCEDLDADDWVIEYNGTSPTDRIQNEVQPGVV